MKRTVAHRARRQAARHRRKMKAINRRLDEFGKLFKARLAASQEVP